MIIIFFIVLLLTGSQLGRGHSEPSCSLLVLVRWQHGSLGRNNQVIPETKGKMRSPLNIRNQKENRKGLWDMAIWGYLYLQLM